MTEEKAGRPRFAPPWYALLCGALLCAVIAAAVGLGGRMGESPGPRQGKPAAAAGGRPAAEIEGIATWLNGEPMTLAQLRGQVTLLDFWTYTCVNCVRSFPQLKLWQSQYADDGLVVIGIHTPEFEFEKDPDKVTKAARLYGVTWPIALDNDYVTWDNYLNLAWPTKFLVDAEGRVRHHRVGEGGYPETERVIRQLLVEAGADLSDDPPVTGGDPALDAAYEAAPDREVTRELYAGFARGAFEQEHLGQGYVGQPEYYAQAGATLELAAPDYLQPNLLYFNGHWRNEAQSAAHARLTDNYEDYVALVYSARSVNAVLTAEGEEPYKVRVTSGGEYLTEENRGEDVVIAADGESYLMVDESRMYRVVENPAYAQRRELRLSANSDRFGVYAFTFGVMEEGP